MDTTHTISNVRVSYVNGADTASMTANALAQHCPPGRGCEADGPKYLVAAEYLLDLKRDSGEDGLWRITKWVFKKIWTQGDESVLVEARRTRAERLATLDGASGGDA
jgi:hypothetical protein